jgi:hypothetical protein
MLILALTLPFGAARAGVQEGVVSWYGERFHNRPTASGELFESWPGWPEGKAYCTPLGLHELRGKTSSVNLYSVQSCPADYS